MKTPHLILLPLVFAREWCREWNTLRVPHCCAGPSIQRPRLNLAAHAHTLHTGIGHGYGPVGFVLMLIAASGPIQNFLGIGQTRWFLFIAVPTGLALFYGLGVLSKRSHYLRDYKREEHANDELLQSLKK